MEELLTRQQGRVLTAFLMFRDTAKLGDILNAFIYSSAHKSPKTIKTLYETLTPFSDWPTPIHEFEMVCLRGRKPTIYS
jgi:hypothetical protein